MSANEARRDLREKIRLERLLFDELRLFNRALVRQTIREYKEAGRAFNAATMQPELTAMLERHYERVGDEFDSQITDQLPDDIAATSAEVAAITLALDTFFSSRAPEQSTIITETNQRDIDDSIDQSIMISQEEPQTRIELAIIAGALLSRKLSGRIGGITSLETQAAAETAKATEAQVLTFQPPSVTGGTPTDVPVAREWVTVGDESVRPAHVGADAQTVGMNEPFTVGGQLLRWPGDTSLGATVDNVINCRCSSVVDAQNVFAVRRRRGEMPRVDLTASEQLLTSLGA
jgi:hypothetical protein